MTPETRNPDDTNVDTPEHPPAQLFAIFANERRQRALTYLCQRPGAVLLGDLAEYLSIAEGVPSRERYERICTDLYHSHLPRMCEAGVVRFDEDTELITVAVDRGVLAPYIDLAGHADV